MSKPEVITILERLEGVVRSFGESEANNYEKPEDVTKEEWALKKSDFVANALNVTTDVFGADDDSNYAPLIKEVFGKNSPNQVTAIYATNKTAYRRVMAQDCVRSFELQLDFLPSPILDTNPVSEPTPNSSYLKVSGPEEWVSSIEGALSQAIRGKLNNRRLLHQAFVYDLGVALVAIPLALIAAYFVPRLAPEFFTKSNNVLISAVYIYIFYICLLVFRFLFSYLRWLFPTVELTQPNTSQEAQRKKWKWIALAVIGAWIAFLVIPSD